MDNINPVPDTGTVPDLEKGMDDVVIDVQSLDASPTQTTAEDGRTTDHNVPAESETKQRKKKKAPQFKLEDLHFTTRDYEKCPNGYPQLAALLSRNQSFLVFRRFNYLLVRLIFQRQDELRQLEEQLDRLDGTVPDDYLGCREVDDRDSGERRMLLREIETTFVAYAKLLESASKLSMFDVPSDRDLLSVVRYFRNHAPLVRKEGYILFKDDLITLKPWMDSSGLDDFYKELLANGRPNWLRRWMRDSDNSSEAMELYKPIGRYYRWLKNATLYTALFALLLGPVYPLYSLSQVPSTPVTLTGTILVQLFFAALFAVGIRFFTRAKRHEVFVASVTYMAVLVVFMTQSKPGSLGNE